VDQFVIVQFSYIDAGTEAGIPITQSLTVRSEEPAQVSAPYQPCDHNGSAICFRIFALRVPLDAFWRIGRMQSYVQMTLIICPCAPDGGRDAERGAVQGTGQRVVAGVGRY
jgi:hypothetical protein